MNDVSKTLHLFFYFILYLIGFEIFLMMGKMCWDVTINRFIILSGDKVHSILAKQKENEEKA